MDIKSTIRRAIAFAANTVTRRWLLLLKRYYLHYKCRISLNVNGVYLYCHKWDPDFEDRLKHNGIALTEEMYRLEQGPEVKRRMPLINLSWVFFRIKETKKVCGIGGSLFIYEKDRRNELFTINGKMQTEITPDGTVLRLMCNPRGEQKQEQCPAHPSQVPLQSRRKTINPIRRERTKKDEIHPSENNVIKVDGATIDNSF